MTNQYGGGYPQQNGPSGPGGPPMPHPDVEQLKKNALIATIIGFVCGGTIPGVLGVIGYVQADQAPETARKLVKWAWISFAIIWGIAILAIIAYVVFFVGLLGFAFLGTSAS